MSAIAAKIWTYVKSTIRFRTRFCNNEERFDWTKDSGTSHRQKQLGLKENIVLPSTGKRAIANLLYMYVMWLCSIYACLFSSYSRCEIKDCHYVLNAALCSDLDYTQITDTRHGNRRIASLMYDGSNCGRCFS